MKKWLLLFLILPSFACSNKVISYLNTEAKFAEFKSFRIVSTKLEGRKIPAESSPIFEEIKQSIIDQMTKRSYELSNITPDLTLRYELSSTSRSEQNNVNNSIYNPIGFPYTNINSRTIHESILILELYDDKKKLIWQGSYDLRNEKKEKKTSKAIQNAVEEIFTTYPYRAGSQTMDHTLTNTKKKKND